MTASLPLVARLPLVGLLALSSTANKTRSMPPPDPPLPVLESFQSERQVTRTTHGHILSNFGVWSLDSTWILYDTRSDPEGARFDGQTIEQVHVLSGEIRTLYRASRGARCGVVTSSPTESKAVFIHGPENPTPDWSYSPWHRRGVIVHTAQPTHPVNLDARDLVHPFTPGALRGGSHLHVFSPDGRWISFTYEDHLLAQIKEPAPHQDLNQRNIGVAVPIGPLIVPPSHPRNHNGSHFSVLVTRTTSHPTAGSDDIIRACEEAWVGHNGYHRTDGIHQRRALAFQGHVLTHRNEFISEVFIVDIPDDVTQPGAGPLQGTLDRMPAPPKNTRQRRLTHSADRPFPGVQGPRHWLRSSPDGSRIAFLMKDDLGIVQLWTISPNGGLPTQLTHSPHPVSSAFTWSPDGRHIAHTMDKSVCLTDSGSGQITRLTPRSNNATAPRPEACVFSPDGRKIAFLRHIPMDVGTFNQIFVVSLD